MDIKNRDLGPVERIDGISLTVRMDGDKARTLTDGHNSRILDQDGLTLSNRSNSLNDQGLGL
jgi:hypothetical protein